ncbi:MAG TPA: ABC transporter substrate-binding protein, partial [Desulfuromonadales bacterium]|nr:ABC transporter substrate-binding protein [Desulfuromonadales bacterium]
MSDNRNSELIERMAAEARRGRLSRRDFIRYAIAAGVTTAAASGIWTSKVALAAPKKGGRFRLGAHDGNTSDTFDPGTYLSFAMIQLAHTHRSYLTMITPTNDLGPDIADSWEATPGAKNWTFKLTKNASFHSGKKMTADDVIASMNHHRGEKSTSAAKALLKDVDDIVKNDDYSITFKLATGNADLPWLMTDYHLAICPANSDGSINWQTGDGTGPYKIVNNQFGVNTELVRHEGWHLEGAYFDEAELTVLNDPNARQTALVTGDVD